MININLSHSRESDFHQFNIELTDADASLIAQTVGELRDPELKFKRIIHDPRTIDVSKEDAQLYYVMMPGQTISKGHDVSTKIISEANKTMFATEFKQDTRYVDEDDVERIMEGCQSRGFEVERRNDNIQILTISKGQEQYYINLWFKDAETETADVEEMIRQYKLLKFYDSLLTASDQLEDLQKQVPHSISMFCKIPETTDGSDVEKSTNEVKQLLIDFKGMSEVVANALGKKGTIEWKKPDDQKKLIEIPNV